MTTENIIIELQNIINNNEPNKINDLINRLKSDLNDKNYIKTPSDKSKLASIKKVLKKNEKIRPVLSCFTPFNDGIAFTDAYQLYYIKDKFIPFKIAFNDEISIDEQKQYIEKYNLEKREGNYPNLKSCIPSGEPLEVYKVNLNEFLRDLKTTTKEKNKGKIMSFNINDSYKLTFNGEFLENTINILKINKDFDINFYGESSPFTIINDEGELGLILPIKTY